MKALCVRQPYAELIARGVKTHEVRSWFREYRGPLLIVASSQYAYGANETYADSRLKLDKRTTPRSSAVCVVDLVEIFEVDEAGYLDSACCEVDEFCLLWELARPRRVEPFFVAGKLNLFEVSDKLIRLS